MPEVDAEFTALPLRQLADAALSRARELGAEHADLRVERRREQNIGLRDGRVESSRDGEDRGLAVRLVHEGTWGFAAGVEFTVEEAVRLAEQAVEVARVSAPVNTDRVELADEAVYSDATWVSAYEVDPFAVAESDKLGLLTD
ncbi:MAG: PmbA/TldA family metallopeptidase, partial [Geodermatophilaceae bacterium]